MVAVMAQTTSDSPTSVEKDTTQPPKLIRPPYDTEANRRRFTVKTEGANTVVTKKFSLVELLESVKAILLFKVDRPLLQKSFKFFWEIYSISPWRANLQILSRILDA